MKRALAEVGSRICAHLVRGQSAKPYNEMTDAELLACWTDAERLAVFGPELTEDELRLLDVVRETLLHDAEGFASEILEMPEGVDKDLLRAILSYWSREAVATRMTDLEAACITAEDVLTGGAA